MHRKQVSVFGYLPIVFLFLFMSACFASSLPAGKVGRASSPDIIMTRGDACPTREEIIQKTQKLQMPFIANDGQTDERVKFYAKIFEGTVFVTKDGEVVYSLPAGGNRMQAAGYKGQEEGGDDTDGASQEARCRRQEMGGGGAEGQGIGIMNYGPRIPLNYATENQVGWIKALSFAPNPSTAAFPYCFMPPRGLPKKRRNIRGIQG